MQNIITGQFLINFRTPVGRRIHHYRQQNPRAPELPSKKERIGNKVILIYTFFEGEFKLSKIRATPDGTLIALGILKKHGIRKVMRRNMVKYEAYASRRLKSIVS